MVIENCGCEETPTPCVTTNYCTSESSAYCVRYSQGDALSCIGVTPSQNLRLSQILKLMDTAICTISGSGDYSGYDVGCLSPVTTQQSWVEKISGQFCTLQTTVSNNYTTLLNMILAITDPNIGTSTNLSLSSICTEISGMAYVNGTTTLNQHLDKIRTALCSTYNLLQTRTDLSGNTWNTCIASTDKVNVAIQRLVDLICVQQSQIAALSGAISPCGKFDTYVFSSDFTDVINSTNTCYNVHGITIDKSKLLKTSATDSCDGYLGDKIHGGTGILASTSLVTSSTCNFTLSSAVDLSEYFESITINSTLYTPVSHIAVTNPTAIMAYLNTLGLGSFTVILLGTQLTILVQELNGDVPNGIIGSISGAITFSPAGCVTSTCEKVDVSINPNYSHGAWQTPSYAGTYIDSVSPIRFRKSFGKTVRIKGMTNNSNPQSLSTNSTVFTLPAGYRPLEQQVFAIASDAVGTTMLKITTAGVVSILGAYASFSNTTTYLNVSFDID